MLCVRTYCRAGLALVFAAQRMPCRLLVSVISDPRLLFSAHPSIWWAGSQRRHRLGANELYFSAYDDHPGSRFFLWWSGAAGNDARSNMGCVSILHAATFSRQIIFATRW